MTKKTDFKIRKCNTQTGTPLGLNWQHIGYVRMSDWQCECQMSIVTSLVLWEALNTTRTLYPWGIKEGLNLKSKKLIFFCHFHTLTHPNSILKIFLDYFTFWFEILRRESSLGLMCSSFILWLLVQQRPLISWLFNALIDICNGDGNPKRNKQQMWQVSWHIR